MDGAPLSCRVGFDVSGGGPATGGTPKRGVSALGQYFGPSHELAELLPRCWLRPGPRFR